MKKLIVAFGVFCLLFSIASGQIPKESWRDHLAYNRGIHIAISPKKVFYAALKGGMLSYNRETREVEKHSKVTGLSDIDISTLQYSEQTEMLIIGYASGNIDLMTHDGIINLPDIVRKRMIASKRINKIICTDNLAYLACDFGIVVVDLIKTEIKDSYLFGPGGNTIKVNDVALFENYIYAATELGLYKADLNSPNLLDFSNWVVVSELPVNNAEYTYVTSVNDKLMAAYKSLDNGNSFIVLLENSVWKNWNGFQDTIIGNIDFYNNMLSINNDHTVYLFNTQLQPVTNYQLQSAKHAQLSNDGILYAATYSNGFYKFEGGQGRQINVPNPWFNPQGKIKTIDDYVWVGSGGPARPYNEGGVHVFFEERWNSKVNGNTSELTNVGNLYKFAFDPQNHNHVYASGYQYGIYEFNDIEVVNSYTWENTPVFRQNIDSVVQVRAMGLDFDKDNNLWVVMNEAEQPVYVLRKNGEWEHIELESSMFTRRGIYAELVVTENNQIWILSRSNGMVVIKEENGTIIDTTFPLKNQDGDLISVAYSMTEDKEGNLWIGTNKGPLIYSPYDDIFTDNNVEGYQVKLPRNDGENGADFLLDYEILNDIAVDGGNRKWIATENSGVFLVSEDGKKTYHNFTFENSPLISNNVIGIGVQEKTGEVFICTNYGLVSYMGTSSEGSDDYSNVYAFPNPVRPEYDGLITIAGLIKNSNVKITDVAGNIVYETTSKGGQATWDGKNFYGERASTGVYLVFLINEDGSKTHVTKILFIH